MRTFLSFVIVSFAWLAGAAHGATSATAISPQYTSVEAGFSQTFSAQFTTATGAPAVGETVSFSNDACGTFPGGTFFGSAITNSNGVASINFTALSPGGVVCTVVASAGAQVRYQVITYRLGQVGVVANAPSNPTPGASFTIPVEVWMGAYSLPNVDVTARVVAGTGNATVSPSSWNTGAGGNPTNLTVTPSGAGDFDVQIYLRGTLMKTIPIRFVSTTSGGPHQDLWWSGIGENGWGLSIIEHRDVLFVLVYAYDDAGKPTWYVISSGTWNGNSYSGSIYSPRGTPFYAYDASRLSMGAPVGTATISFTDSDHASLDYTINGVAGHKNITRTLFGPSATSPMTGRTDMWWGGLSQNGWGIAVIQQNAALFAMWYTYDDSGMPLWYAMPSGSWTASDTYEGRVYRTTGSPWLGHTYDASLFRPVDVGSYRLRFSGDTATFDYSVEGRTGSLPLTRTPF